MRTLNSTLGILIGAAIATLPACGNDGPASSGTPDGGAAQGGSTRGGSAPGVAGEPPVGEGGSGGQGSGGEGSGGEGSGGDGVLAACHPINVDAALCDPAVASFSLASTNPYYPLIVGSIVELAGEGEGDEAGINITVTREVLDETRTIMGVETHVLRHETNFDGVLHEVALNFYVEASDGTVCYFGEDVEFYDDKGTFANTDGTWKAGEDGALPGVIMPASPVAGDAYYQELAPGIALDMGRIAADDLATALGSQVYDTIQVMDSNPISPDETCVWEEKRYAYGIGEVKDTVLELVSFTPGPTPLPKCHVANVAVALCDPSVATFSLASTNPYYPLNVGSIVELAGVGVGDEVGINITVKREVLAETRSIMGVQTHVLRHETKFDGILHEVALNFYVEATDGTVCYFGEDVEFYDSQGVFENTNGTWKAGENGALPGVIMPATPELGSAYYQEYAPGIALDMGRIAAVNLTTLVNAQSYKTIQVIDTNPIAPEEACAEEEKRYALGIGEVRDTVLDVVSFTP